MTRLVLSGLLATAVLSAQSPPPQQTPPVFKGGTTVVPLTVVVLDKNGAPVKDLKQSDFTIYENKQPREIVNFFPEEFVPGAVSAAPEALSPGGNRVRNDTVAPQTRRTFLIVLGYGRIEYPTKALEGAADFVRHHLLPQDAVAVMGFHRATNFTTDHEAIAQILERYRKDHERICFDIDEYRLFSQGTDKTPMIGIDKGSTGGGGGAPIPEKFLKRIDDVFTGPVAATGAPTPSAPITLRNVADMLLVMGRAAPVVEKPGQHLETIGEILTQLRNGGDDLTDAVLLSTRLKLFAGIEYLRYLEGDKHIMFFAGGGVARNVDDAQIVAKRATDARVVVDVIATNGTPAPPVRGGAPPPLITAMPGGGDPPGRIVAELTGGMYTSLDMAAKAAAKVDQGSRFTYLLGYTPLNSTLDGKYRDVQVKVNRPDVTVLYRHGYFAASEPEPLELKDLLIKSRLERALSFDQQAKDIPLTAIATLLPRMGIQTEMRVEISIGAGPLVIPVRDGVRIGQLEVEVYCGDVKQAVVGDVNERLEIKASEEQYQQWLQTGIHRIIRVPSFGPPKYVKVVVYDYGSDKVGSVMITLK